MLVIMREDFSDVVAPGKTKIEKPGADIGWTWWAVNETSDEDIILRESRDKIHLVAVVWPGKQAILFLILSFHVFMPDRRFNLQSIRKENATGTERFI
jgi:hypothetical protein